MSRQYPLDLAGRPDYSARSFVYGPTNAEAVSRLQAPEHWAGHVLALYGPPGSGKTHMGMIWASEQGEQGVITLDGAAGFIPRKDYRGQSIWIDTADKCDEYSLFTLINLALTSEIKALLLTSQTRPADWPVQLPDLKSRLRNVQTVGIQEADDEVLSSIIDKLFRDRGLVVSEQLIQYLLAHADRSIDSLRRLIADIDREAASQAVNVTRSFVAKFMQTNLI